MNQLMVLQNKLESATATPAVINFPITEAKALVTEYMRKYENVVYSDDVIKQVKDDKKELNKVKKQINDFGIKTDKELSANIKSFRNDLKDLIAMIDEPMDKIDAAIDEFEERRKREKQLGCQNIIDDRIRNSGLMEQFAKKVELKEQYLNASVTLKHVEADVMAQITLLQAEQEKHLMQVAQIEQQVEMSNMRHGLNVELKATTFLSMLAYRPFEEIKELIEKQATEQKQSEIAFAEKIRAEEEKKANEATVAQVEAIVESVQKFIPVEAAVDEKVMMVTLHIKGTKTQMDALKSYMDASGITYKKA
jgi:hypothetical protein